MGGVTRSVGPIVRVCEAGGDARELRVRLLEALRHQVGFDFHAFVLTDPETSVGSAPLAAVPAVRDLPRLIRLRYLTGVNRWTVLDEPPVALLSTGDPARSLLWRELLAGYGVSDVASVVFRDRFGCWGFLELWRTGGVFGAAEAAFLAEVAGPVTAALRRAQADTFVARPPGSRRLGPLVLLLSPELTVLGQTPETHEFLRVLVPPAPDRPPIPAATYNVAAQLLAVEAGVDGNPPSARVHLEGGLWLTLRAARIGGRDIAVTIEETPPGERVTLFCRAYGLSGRETELLGHLAAGADTREVARRMFLSEHTVQDHLKSVFARTGARSRRTLLARALGWTPGAGAAGSGPTVTV
ncbi:helix-turn-helix transcriptional regulator [Longispora sp. K20-0274]|uniref:helix-turn-helix transcriptional regulator n=1 Tax=Longispora sp. K20-0274 TaxID=3088255 RepID=UPI00399AE4B8